MDILLLAAGVVVLAMAAVLAVMMWQSRRSRRLLDRRHEVIEREQREVDDKMAEARRRGLDQQDGRGTPTRTRPRPPRPPRAQGANHQIQ